MIKAVAVLAGLAVPASANDWLSSENQALKLPAWQTSGQFLAIRSVGVLGFTFSLTVEKVLLSEEPTPDDFADEAQGPVPMPNMLPGFTTLENYPNPMINVSACRRWGMDVSYVCDPGKSGCQLSR